MEIYINGLSCISHHNTFDDSYFFEDVTDVPTSNHLLATEPNYKEYIQPVNRLRRMSHIVKMGVTATITATKNEDKAIDAVIVGTGIGCFVDTDKFLRSLIENDETLLTPTAFIQSTHNTVAGQIALLIKCFGYNFTYVHQNLSFEHALIDAGMLMNEKEAETILLGAIDESNDSLLELYERVGHLKSTDDLAPVWSPLKKGYVLGETANFFSVTGVKTTTSIAKVSGVKCIQAVINAEDLMQKVESFLAELNLTLGEIDIMLSGNCGDKVMDENISTFNSNTNLPIGYFKNLCGESFTASGFAVWLASQIIRRQTCPNAISATPCNVSSFNNILIVNHYHDQQYSLICVSKC